MAKVLKEDLNNESNLPKPPQNPLLANAKNDYNIIVSECAEESNDTFVCEEAEFDSQYISE